jgi:HD-GYP domain-containing protein (c-di-GMP phosphodiesterase class II)/methylmalonyl-CoA mutase cobalamin-binding subunit
VSGTREPKNAIEDTHPRRNRKDVIALSGLSQVGLRWPGQHGEARRWALWALLCVVAAFAATLVITASATAAVCAAVLVGAATVLGWRLGEDTRASLRREIEGRSGELEHALAELENAQAETVRRLAMAVEFRDEDTGEHIERIGRLSALLAEEVGMDKEFCARLRYAAPLHDVGKVAIPDAILLKPGPLTPEERAIVETHAEEGHRLVGGSSSSILDLAATIALSHQEKWDGTGYPRGLAGEEIPLEGRIVAVADVFDALTSDRVYRKAFSVEEAVRMMRAERGRHFDPVLLDAFMKIIDRAGDDVRAPEKAEPLALVRSTREKYSTALQRGDAEVAEEAIARALEEGLSPRALHTEVIVPALRQVGELWQEGELDLSREQLATSITRRVLASVYRYILGSTESTRERVLLAGVEGDEHTLQLEMVRDQLAAAGYETILDTDLSVEGLRAAVESESPDVVVLGATVVAAADAVKSAVSDLRSRHPDLPIVLGGAAVGHEIEDERSGMRVLDNLDESVEAIEDLLTGPAVATLTRSS